MGKKYINSTKKRKARSTLFYCAGICGKESRPQYGKFQNNGWNTVLNGYNYGLPAQIATYVALQEAGLGSKPMWDYPVQGKRFGLANPPNYNPSKLINQYGRLNGTGGQPLRNF